MTNEERKTALLELWHDIATDRSLQVGLRLKASEYEAKALGLIGDQPGVTILNEPDSITQQLNKLTIAQLEAIAEASDDQIASKAEKMTAQKRAEAMEAEIVDNKPISKAKTATAPLKSPNTANSKVEVAK